MTTDQLLQPRFEVIADYPDSRYKVGEILDRDWGWNGDDVDGFNNKISDYPHLFRKLQWWEKRKVEDMPMYVKCIKTPDQIHMPDMVYKMEYKDASWGKDENNYSIIFYTGCYIPSTETEYLEFKNKE